MGKARGAVSGDGGCVQALSVLIFACRKYSLKKITENNEAEIMEVIAQEAQDSYESEIVVELKSESVGDLESNVARIVDWIHAWKKDHPGENDRETLSA
jgi:broad-specificity NMP kinase